MCETENKSNEFFFSLDFRASFYEFIINLGNFVIAFWATIAEYKYIYTTMGGVIGVVTCYMLVLYIVWVVKLNTLLSDPVDYI